MPSPLAVAYASSDLAAALTRAYEAGQVPVALVTCAALPPNTVEIQCDPVALGCVLAACDRGTVAKTPHGEDLWLSMLTQSVQSHQLPLGFMFLTADGDLLPVSAPSMLASARLSEDLVSNAAVYAISAIALLTLLPPAIPAPRRAC